MESAPSAFMQSLREATRSAHADIEHVPALSRLLAADLTRAEYGETLSRLYSFHAALEPRLAAALAGMPGMLRFTAPERARAIATDLADLGLEAPPPAPAAALPELADAAAGLGCLYVVEGSALGGRVIARRLADTLGVTQDDGARFFTGDTAAAVRRRWLALCEGLEAASRTLDPPSLDRLHAGAIACFTRMGSWMREAPLPHPSRPQTALAHPALGHAALADAVAETAT